MCIIILLFHVVQLVKLDAYSGKSQASCPYWLMDATDPHPDSLSNAAYKS